MVNIFFFSKKIIQFTWHQKKDAGDDDDESSDIPDMETFDGENLGEEEDDDAAFVAAPAVAASAGQDDGETNIVLTRTYDISITYDKYYQTPKLWLFGYDESRQPLKPEQVFQDISVDHAQKTGLNQFIDIFLKNCFVYSKFVLSLFFFLQIWSI